MKKITLLFTVAFLFVMSTSFSQLGNTIDDAIPLDGNSATPNLSSLGSINNSGLEPQCQTTADIFLKHTISAGDNKFVYGISTTAAAVAGTTIDYQLFRAPDGNMSDLEEITCDNYSIVASEGGSFENVIENVAPGDEYYLRLFKPTGISDTLLIALANITSLSMESTFDSTLSVENLEQSSFKIAVKNNNIHLFNNVDYKDFSVFAIDGKQVMSKRSNNHIQTIDISALDRGLYILMVQNGGASKAHKFVKN